MFITQEKKEYQLKMYELKKSNRDYFFGLSLKRKILKPFLKSKLTRNLVQRFTPYSYEDIDCNVNYFSSKRIAIYTAIYGNYDQIFEPRTIPDNCDFYIFTDDINKIPTDSAWEYKEFSRKEFDSLTFAEKNRYLKMHPHILFPDYEYSIYVDGNIEIVTDFTEFIHDFNEYGIKMHNHYKRNCIYQEIDECIKYRKCSVEQLQAYRKKLEREKFPHQWGLLEAPVICREHNNEKCIMLMDVWWKEFYSNIRRDQIALAYVLFKYAVDIKSLNGLGKDIHANYAFVQHSHK